jgi:hypothetical protein
VPETVSELTREAGFSIVRQDSPAPHIITLAKKP